MMALVNGIVSRAESHANASGPSQAGSALCGGSQRRCSAEASVRHKVSPVADMASKRRTSRL
eukprot:3491045-Prymnesium_polylepis.2